jgi:hypothetical protein
MVPDSADECTGGAFTVELDDDRSSQTRRSAEDAPVALPCAGQRLDGDPRLDVEF